MAPNTRLIFTVLLASSATASLACTSDPSGTAQSEASSSASAPSSTAEETGDNDSTGREASSTAPSSTNVTTAEGTSTTDDTDDTDDTEAPSGEPAITQGLSTNGESCAVITQCPGMFTEARCGDIPDADGTRWDVPTSPSEASACTDLYNDCTGSGHNPTWEDDLETVDVDEGGEVVTGFVHGDNYFELYVNGQSICRDPIAFTPFNSSVVRFSATRPVTYAVRLVDWEEHLGVGMEYDTFNVGDGGFAAAFSDGTTTGSDWKCQVLYTSPVDDPACVSIEGQERDSTGCSTQPECKSNPELCYGLHWAEPSDWTQPGFDDTDWPNATVFSDAQVNPKPAFTDYPTEFSGASFIWGPNLVLDNEILCRLTVE